jgi:thiamine-phosphate pyrophosphorylase
MRPGPLYPIIDVVDDRADERDRAMALAVALAGVGIDLLQIRAKTLGAGAFTELAVAMVARLSPVGCRLVVNDRADVALAAGAAGVHVGDEDLPVEAVRRILGPDAIVGFSTHSLAEVHAAARLPVDYIGFGPVADSPTKAGVREPRGMEALAEVCRTSAHPVVAIGGITLETGPACLRAGAASVAVISDLAAAADPASRARAWLAAAAEVFGD